MSRSDRLRHRALIRVPRASGDEPFASLVGVREVQCSPRERG